MGWDKEVPATIPAEDLTITAQWSVNQYTITFANTGDTVIEPITQGYGTDVPEIADPEKTGYTFAGWDVEIPATMPANDLTVTAQWVPNTTPAEPAAAAYYVRHYVETEPGVYTLVETEILTAELGKTVTADTAKHAADGYHVDESKSTLSGNVTIDLTTENPVDTLLALEVYYSLNEYTVQFDAKGGTEVAPQTVKHGCKVIEPAKPVRFGYTFVRWELNGAAYDFDSAVTGNMTLTAKWKHRTGTYSGPVYHKITVEVDGVVSSHKEACKGEIVTLKVEEGVVVVVVDEKGNKIDLSWDDGVCKFRMPDCAVVVKGYYFNPFIDVANKDYYADAVLWALRNGITNGITANTFCPDMICTRAQMVTFLWRAAGKPQAETAEMPFTDVSEGAYYYDAVLWAVENGITNGTSATTFSPNAEVTRAQTVTFLWRMQNQPEADGEMIFTDVKQDAYYAEAVLWAVEAGITNGTSATTFSPNAGCTRAQIVTFLWRCFK